MRSKDKPASLAELLGKDAGGKLSVSDIPQLLGEKMPELPRNRVGKFRLINALKMRFGDQFRNIPGVKDIIADFDKDVQVENIVKLNKEAQDAKSS